jgi:predicted nucleotidyltransferase
MMLSQEQ